LENRYATKIIKIIPTKKSGGSWCAEEAPDVALCFPGPNGKQNAIDYAQGNRFGGSSAFVCRGSRLNI